MNTEFLVSLKTAEFRQAICSLVYRLRVQDIANSRSRPPDYSFCGEDWQHVRIKNSSRTTVKSRSHGAIIRTTELTQLPTVLATPRTSRFPHAPSSRTLCPFRVPSNLNSLLIDYHNAPPRNLPQPDLLRNHHRPIYPAGPVHPTRRPHSSPLAPHLLLRPLCSVLELAIPRR